MVEPKLICRDAFPLKDGYFCQLQAGHDGDHESECPNPQFHQSWPQQPKRIQRKRTKGWRMPANTVYVGRPSVYGNPFRVSNGDCDHPDCGPKSHPPLTAQDAVDAFRRYLPGLVKVQPPGFLEALRGKDLACWCPLDQPCHADVLLEVANAE